MTRASAFKNGRAPPVRWLGALYPKRLLEVHATQEQVEVTIALSTEHTLPQWLAPGRLALGWALVRKGFPKQPASVAEWTYRYDVRFLDQLV